MLFYIPSMGRPNKQITVKVMHPSLHDNTFLVVPVDEAEAYVDANPTVDVIPVPRRVKGIAATRDYILDHAEDRYICMLDDDLRFQTKTPENRVLTCKPAVSKRGFAQLERWLKNGLAHCGFTVRFLNWQRPYEETHLDNQRMMHVLAYDVDAVRRAGARFTKGVTRSFSMDDFHMTLQLLRAGHANRISLRYVSSPSASNSKGGASDWRTLESHNASAAQLKKLHGDLVAVKEKHGWQGMDGTRYDVICKWRAAYESAR